MSTLIPGTEVAYYRLIDVPTNAPIAAELGDVWVTKPAGDRPTFPFFDAEDEVHYGVSAELLGQGVIGDDGCPTPTQELQIVLDGLAVQRA